MTKDDRYGAVGDAYGTSGDTYGDSSDAVGQNGDDARPNGSAAETDPEVESETVSQTTSASADDRGGVAALPFIFARRTVKADRDALPVYVRTSTADDIDELERELEGRFDGDDVMSLDVREAVVKAGLRNLDDVVDVMEEWGYGRR